MRVSEEFPDKNVCIIGMGYVGVTLAVAMAEVGFRIFGVDTTDSVVEAVSCGEAHFKEVGLNEVLRRQVAAGRLSMAKTLPLRSEGVSVYIITVGTPVGRDKSADFKAILVVAGDLGRIIKSGDMVLLRSTVRVGTTRNVFKAMLDRSGVAHDIAFCPERTLEGKALAELRSLPQIVGGLTMQATLRAMQLFSFLTPTVVMVSSPEAAELVKLINNTQRDLMFAFANEVAEVCDAAGVSATEVINAGNRGYPRGHMPLPGPVGGPCLEKDPYIFAESSALSGTTPRLALAGRKVNEDLPKLAMSQVAQVYRNAVSNKTEPRRVALLGVAFKGVPETDDLRGSVAIHLIRQIKAHFPRAALVGFDPVVDPEGIKSLNIEPIATLEQAFEGTGVVIIQNNHPCFRDMPLDRLSAMMAKPGFIYDFWFQQAGRESWLAPDVYYGGLGNLAGFERQWPADSAQKSRSMVA